MKQYIFGYGSLISAEVRNQTSTSQDVIQARVKGYRRFWSGFPLYGWAPLAVRTSTDATCNGALIGVSEEQIEAFDSREVSYVRKLVEHDQIELLEDANIGEASVWLYAPTEPLRPSMQSPILQSYVDVAITGCLDYSEDFAREFIQTTKNWDAPWRNDRANPEYSRSLEVVERADEIDKLLTELLPEPFENRFL
ncbi:MAG: gamma-glutamylcyclotransferase [Bdellovibrionales bacterium]|nr:gamma-glutamylcyclotransferase [Bdellovibrionales bacterium]